MPPMSSAARCCPQPAAELRRLADQAQAPASGSILLAAMTAAWDRVEDLSGDGLVLAGRALLLLGMAIDRPRL